MKPGTRPLDRVNLRVGFNNYASKVSPNSMNSSFKNIPPFLVSSSGSKKEDTEKEILEVFKKVKLNIPLLDAIK
jgi:hypothetical protein